MPAEARGDEQAGGRRGGEWASTRGAAAAVPPPLCGHRRGADAACRVGGVGDTDGRRDGGGRGSYRGGPSLPLGGTLVPRPAGQRGGGEGRAPVAASRRAVAREWGGTGCAKRTRPPRRAPQPLTVGGKRVSRGWPGGGARREQRRQRTPRRGRPRWRCRRPAGRRRRPSARRRPAVERGGAGATATLASRRRPAPRAAMTVTASPLRTPLVTPLATARAASSGGCRSAGRHPPPPRHRPATRHALPGPPPALPRHSADGRTRRRLR